MRVRNFVLQILPETGQLLSRRGIVQFAGAPPCQDHDIEMGREVSVLAKPGPDQAFESVSLYCAGDVFFSDDEA